MIGKTYGVTSYGYSQWFLPAIKSVYSIIDNKIVSLNTAFSCFQSNTKTIDAYFNNLIAGEPKKAYEITKIFTDNKALTHQSFWQLSNASSKTLKVVITRNSISTTTYLYSTTSDKFVIGQMAGQYNNISSLINSTTFFPQEISIFVVESGKDRRIFYAKGNAILQDLTRSFTTVNNWVVSNEYTNIGGKSTTTINYEITASDI